MRQQYDEVIGREGKRGRLPVPFKIERIAHPGYHNPLTIPLQGIRFMLQQANALTLHFL